MSLFEANVDSGLFVEPKIVGDPVGIRICQLDIELP